MRPPRRPRALAIAVAAPPLLVWSLWAMAPFESRRPTPHDTAADFRRHLDARAPQLLERFGVPGVSLATVVAGQPSEAYAYGLADVATRRPVTPDTAFEVASISKSFAAYGIMRLVQSGRMDLDTPVGAYLPDWPLAPSPFPKDAVTVRRLLKHVAGVNPGNIGVRGPTEAPQTTLALLRGEGRNPAVRTAGPARLVQPVERGFLYSNPGYLLLQDAAEETTGVPFAAYLDRDILAPLGMGRSSFRWSPALGARLATPYLSDGRADAITVRDDAANGSLMATAPDLARFLAAEMRPAERADQPGRLTASWLGEMMRADVPLPITQVQGMGSDRGAMGHYAETLADGRTAIMNGGFSPGWTSQFYIVPASGDGIAVLTSSDRGRAVIAEVIADWAAWRGLPPLKMTRTYRMVGVGGPLLASALLLLAAATLAGAWRPGRSGQGPALWRRGLAAAGRLTLAGGLAAAWFGVARMTLKFAFPWLDLPLSLGFGALALALTVRAILPWLARPRPAAVAD